MSVFHYCDELLKDTPLFETCEDSFVLDTNPSTSGAIYNDFDGNPHSLLRDSDFESDQERTSEQDNIDSHDSVVEPDISQSDIDYYFLVADDENESRWVKDHPLFSNDSSKSDHEEKIQKLTEMSLEEWNLLPIRITDTER